MNSHRALGGGGHMTRGAKIPQGELDGRIIWRSDADYRCVLREWLVNEQPQAKDTTCNWMALPVEWIDKNEEREARNYLGMDWHSDEFENL